MTSPRFRFRLEVDGVDLGPVREHASTRVDAHLRPEALRLPGPSLHDRLLRIAILAALARPR